MYWPYQRLVTHGGGLEAIPNVLVDGRIAEIRGAILPTPCLAGCLGETILECVGEPGLYGVIHAGENRRHTSQYYGSFMSFAEFGLLGRVGSRLVSVQLFEGRTVVRRGQVFLEFSGNRGRAALPPVYSALMHFYHLGDEPLYVPGTVGYRYGAEVLLPMGCAEAYAPPDRRGIYAEAA